MKGRTDEHTDGRMTIRLAEGPHIWSFMLTKHVPVARHSEAREPSIGHPSGKYEKIYEKSGALLTQPEKSGEPFAWRDFGWPGAGSGTARSGKLGG